MIEYETLVQAIEDWRAGKRPRALAVRAHVPSAPSVPSAEEHYDELDLEDAYGEEGADGSDFGTFDPVNDLQGYLVAERRLEQAWVDVQARYDLFSEYGIRDEAHFQQIRASVDGFLRSPVGEARWGGPAGVERLRAQVAESLHGGASGALEPVSGVSLRHWAYAQAQIAVGYDQSAVLAQLNISEDLWAEAVSVWNERLAQDDSGVISGEYSQAYAAAQAQVAATSAAVNEGEPPMTFERWVEIEQASAVLAEAGHESGDILAEFSLSVETWDEATQWWEGYLARHGEENEGALLARYQQLQQFYRDHYTAALSE